MSYCEKNDIEQIDARESRTDTALNGSQTEAHAFTVCTNCGAVFPKTDKLCPGCGTTSSGTSLILQK